LITEILYETKLWNGRLSRENS